jgi:hypothetical protein
MPLLVRLMRRARGVSHIIMGLRVADGA